MDNLRRHRRIDFIRLLTNPCHYLGNHGADASLAKYQQLIADDWNPPGTPPKLTVNERHTGIAYGNYIIQYGDDQEASPVSPGSSASVVELCSLHH